MPQQVFGAAAAVSMLNRAFNNTSPSNAVFNNQLQTAGTTQESQIAFANQFAAGFADMPAQQLVEQVLGNMGLLPNDALVEAGVEALEAYGPGMYGAVVLSFAKLLATLENATGEQEIFRDAAVAWNKEVEQSFVYSSNTNNIGPSNPGDGPGGNQSAFVLTTRVESIKSSATEKTVVGIIDTNNSVSTLNAGDVITGTGVDGDTLRVIMTAGTTYPGSATITDIDRIEVQAATAAKFVATGITGAKELISRDSTAAVTFENINSLGTAVGIQNSTQNLTANWEPSLLNGKSDAVTLVLDNATGGAVQNVTLSTGIEVLNVKAVGAASDVSQVDTAAANANFKTMNIAADVALRIRDVADTVTTIDASESTAGVILSGFGKGTEMTITGGSGNDRFIFGKNEFTAKDKIVGGDGVDRLDLTLNNTLAAKNQISGIENISVAADANVTLNLAGNTDIETITVRQDGAANNITVTNVEAPLANVVYEGTGVMDPATGLPATASAAQTFDNLTVNLGVGKGTGANDSTAVSVSNGGVALDALQNHAFALGTLTLNGIENVSLTVADGKSNLTLADTALKSLTVTSTSDVLFNAALNSTGLTTVDGTGVAGKLTVNTATSDTSVTVTLGNGNNDVTFGDGVGGKGNTDVITSIILGTGSNVVREENVDVTTGGLVARNGYAVVSNFDAGVGGDAFGFSAHANSFLSAANFIKQAGTGAAIATSAARKLIVLNDAAAAGFGVTANDENQIVNDFKAWTALGATTWDNALVAQDSDSVVAVNGNDGNTYLFRLDNLDATAGIAAADAVELVAVLNNVNAANLVLNNFVF